MTECWIMRRSRLAREIMATWPTGKRAAYGVPSTEIERRVAEARASLSRLTDDERRMICAPIKER